MLLTPPRSRHWQRRHVVGVQLDALVVATVARRQTHAVILRNTVRHEHFRKLRQSVIQAAVHTWRRWHGWWVTWQRRSAVWWQWRCVATGRKRRSAGVVFRLSLRTWCLKSAEKRLDSRVEIQPRLVVRHIHIRFGRHWSVIVGWRWLGDCVFGGRGRLGGHLARGSP